jgi:hypothetical protein
MDEYFKEDYKEGAVKWSKILGDLHKRIPRRFQLSLHKNRRISALTLA